jgi:hypothetical protein
VKRFVFPLILSFFAVIFISYDMQPQYSSRGPASIQEFEDDIYDNSKIELTEEFQKQAAREVCHYTKNFQDRISLQTKDELISDINSTIDMLEQRLDDAKKLDNRKERKRAKKEIKRHIREMKKWKKAVSPKKKITKLLSGLCNGAMKGIKPITRTLSHINHFALQTVTLPFRFIFNFFKSFITLRTSENKTPTTGFDILGPSRNNLSDYIMLNFSTNTMALALGSNPFTAGFLFSVSIDFITSYQCHYNNGERESLNRFCHNYTKIKDFYRKISKSSEKAGQKVGKLFVFRRKKSRSAKLCRAKHKRQMRVARRIINRKKEIINDPRIRHVDVLKPSMADGCVLIKVYVDEESSVNDLLEKYHAAWDGVGVEYLPYERFQQSEVTDTCDILESHIINLEKGINGFFSQGAQILKVFLKPDQLAMPNFERLQLSSKFVREKSLKYWNLRNIIFSVGPAKELSDEFENTNMITELHDLEKNVQTEAKKYKEMFEKLKRGKFNAKKCKELDQKIGFNYQSYKKHKEKLNASREFSIAKQIRDHSLLLKAFNKNKHMLNLNWEIMQSNTIEEVHDYLRSHDVANAIIVAHGSPKGYIKDGFGEEYPMQSFQYISPTLYSLSFYSCYSQGLDEYYSVEDKLKNNFSYSSQRFFVTVKESQLAEKQNIAPIKNFDFFLSEVDRKLFSELKKVQIINSSLDKKEEHLKYQCHFDLKGLSLEKGRYSVSINSSLIGILNKGEGGLSTEIPCHYLRDYKKNYIHIKSLSTEKFGINPDQVEVELRFKKKLSKGKNELVYKKKKGRVSLALQFE